MLGKGKGRGKGAGRCHISLEVVTHPIRGISLVFPSIQSP